MWRSSLFNHNLPAVGTPFPTFGEVVATIPPGLVFKTGMYLSSDQQIVPIRFLHFERDRIVIDVAGQSSAISAIFESIQRFLSELRSPDGSPIIGKPERILDYSEITAKYPFVLDSMLSRPLRKLLSKKTSTPGSKNGSVLIPTLAVQAYPYGQALPAVPGANDVRVFTFSLRSGTRPEEHIYFSSAPLDSEAHLSYLRELETALGT